MEDFPFFVILGFAETLILTNDNLIPSSVHQRLSVVTSQEIDSVINPYLNKNTQYLSFMPEIKSSPHLPSI